MQAVQVFVSKVVPSLRSSGVAATSATTGSRCVAVFTMPDSYLTPMSSLEWLSTVSLANWILFSVFRQGSRHARDATAVNA